MRGVRSGSASVVEELVVMSQAPASASGLVKVTVTSGTRRVDLVLPAAVPVAELLPELVRSVGLLDGSTVYGGYQLVTQEGRQLAPDASLTMQGVEDGGVLTVAAGVDEPAPRVYDDVVEAMTDVVERDLKPWEPAAGRRTAMGAAALLLALGAVALLIQAGSIAAAAAVVVAVALVTGAIVLSRAQGEPEAAVPVAWMGAGYAAVAGLLLAPEGELLALPVAGAGAGALVAGLICLVGLDQGRTLMLPPVVVGAIFLATGLLMQVASFDPAVVLTVALVLIVIAGSVFPWLALGATGTKVDQLFSVADITADPDEVDPDEVGADARVAHEILLAVTGTVGLLLVLITPLAISLGLFGTLVAVMCCVVLMLRTRQYRIGSEVLVGLVAGVAGLATVAVSVLWLHPTWRPATAVALAAAGAVLLAVTVLPSTPSVRRGRLGDVAETVALVSLPPLLIMATGVFDAIRS
jgi:type VII secretion integral membrane protein EccD